jgi:hypothetical protein
VILRHRLKNEEMIMKRSRLCDYASMLGDDGLLTNNSKFYNRSLTLLLPILQMIREGFILTRIAEVLKMEKPHVSYYLGKAKKVGFVNEVCRDRIKILELTHAGKRFLDLYAYKYSNLASTKQQLPHCRAENVRFKAVVYRHPIKPVDWNRIAMNNWSQYTSIVDNVKVHLNDGKAPTIEFIPSPIDGSNPWELLGILFNDCNGVARKLEQTLDMEIGRLEIENHPEWVVYDPVANFISKHNGQITVDGIGKINASKPWRRGEIEYFDPRFAADYITMPMRISNIERILENLREGSMFSKFRSEDQISEVGIGYTAEAGQSKDKDRNSNREGHNQ